MWWLKLILGLALGGYLIVAAILFFAQTALLFPARLATPAGPPPPRAEPLELAAPSGHRLHGLHIAPLEPSEHGRLLVLGFGGNAWNAQAAAQYLHGLYPDAHVVAFHYRGYAPTGGSPGAAALQEDALLVHDFVRERLDPQRVVAVGFSIGSGVAAHLAAHRPVDGAIRVTPFDSLAGLAAGHYPWLPVRLLLRHRMEPAAELARTQVPVALIAAGRDTIIPPPRTEALRRALPNLVFDRTFVTASHNDIYDRADFRAAMREALAAIDAAR